MFVTPSIMCHNKPFFWSNNFHPVFGLVFPIYLMILCTPIPIIFFPSFPTWGFDSHFVKIKHTIGGPIGRRVVCSSSLSNHSPYNNNPPYLCIIFLRRWYTYSMFRIRCGSYIFMIAKGVINNRFFNVANEMCNLVSSRVGPLYIISS
jgi:hypothetical protein